MSRSRYGGRHELGQNFLHHQPTIHRIVALVARTTGDIVEIGAGDGALTVPLSRLGRDLLAVELDEHRAARLGRRLPSVRVLAADGLDLRIDREVVVGNVPFHATTPILRKLLGAEHWRHAVLLTQWEVARKRAGVGGGTMMTAETAPWFEFELHGRVPASAFRPMPSVDGGLLGIERRAAPLVPIEDRARYRAFVRAVFTGPGRGIGGVLARMPGGARDAPRAALEACGIRRDALPRDLRPEQWAALWSAMRGRG
ncbi:MAG: 23S ribosomal RNA methyltransferase Erm [Microbacteriaceae bacterium]|nr:23S ribosomal RNA methyltransferase Erm [Microbacteriaceae bacterium]